jgi:hypothetical protein
MKAETTLAFACFFTLLAVVRMCTKLKERHSAKFSDGKAITIIYVDSHYAAKAELELKA